MYYFKTYRFLIILFMIRNPFFRVRPKRTSPLNTHIDYITLRFFSQYTFKVTLTRYLYLQVHTA